MRYNSVLLVGLAYRNYFDNDTAIPVGLGYIAQYLETHNIEYDVLDFGLGHPRHERELLFDKLTEYRLHLMGTTMMTLGYREHYLLFNEVKETMPDIDIAIGGPHISTFRERILEECKAIDFGIVLEGEETIIGLCQGKHLSEIKGLIYRLDGKIVYTGDREFIRNLDSVPCPLYRKFGLKQNYGPRIAMASSRGCPYRCTYCPVKDAIGKRFRARSAESVVDEMGHWYEEGFRQFMFWDDSFTLIKPRIYQICDLIEKNGWKDIRIAIPNGVRADNVDRDMLSRMKEVGFCQLSFGVESASGKVLRNLKKGETIRVIEKAIKDACDLGYEVYLYFMIGSPSETWADFEKSLALAKKYPVAEARFYTLIPFPFTELFNWVKGKRYFVRSPDDYLNRVPHFVADPCFATPEMSIEERIKAFNIGWKMTLKQRRSFRARQLRRFGILGKIIALITISNFYHSIFKPVWLRKLVIEPLKRWIFTEKEIS